MKTFCEHREGDKRYEMRDKRYEIYKGRSFGGAGGRLPPLRRGLVISCRGRRLRRPAHPAGHCEPARRLVWRSVLLGGSCAAGGRKRHSLWSQAPRPTERSGNFGERRAAGCRPCAKQPNATAGAACVRCRIRRKDSSSLTLLRMTETVILSEAKNLVQPRNEPRPA